jgi:hypothetical protein
MIGGRNALRSDVVSVRGPGAGNLNGGGKVYH